MRKPLYLGLAIAAFLLLPVVYATPNFSISASPTSLTISAGNSGSSTINLVSNGFSGNVVLSGSVTGNNPTITTTLNPSSVSLSPGSSGQSVLTVTTTPFTPLGTYTITVTGSSGSISNPVTIGVSVVSGTVGVGSIRYQSTGITPFSLGLVAFGAMMTVCLYSGVKGLSAKKNHI